MDTQNNPKKIYKTPQLIELVLLIILVSIAFDFFTIYRNDEH